MLNNYNGDAADDQCRHAARRGCILHAERHTEPHLAGPENAHLSRRQKGDGPKTLICEKEDYHTTTTIIGEEFAGALPGNVILDGGVDIKINAA